MDPKTRSYALGLSYIFAVALIWIAASFVVQIVENSPNVSPFLITLICNSLFIIYIPLVEIARYVENTLWPGHTSGGGQQHLAKGYDSEEANLLGEQGDAITNLDTDVAVGTSQRTDFRLYDAEQSLPSELDTIDLTGIANVVEDTSRGLDAKGRWTRTRMAKVSMIICPFWFCAQLAFNNSIKYTTVTSNTILSTSSSLFTFIMALLFLGETFNWIKLISVLLCMAGTIIVSLADSKSVSSTKNMKPVLGDILALVSAAFYAVYITLLRRKIPDEDDSVGKPSMALFLGFLGLFNLMYFLPLGLVLSFMGVNFFHPLSWDQFGLIIGKGLLDNVLSDYLWAKAVLLTSTTVATAGLTIQVPLAAIVDSVRGRAPHLLGYLGAAAVIFGFTGMNIPSDALFGSRNVDSERQVSNVVTEDADTITPVSGDAPIS